MVWGMSTTTTRHRLTWRGYCAFYVQGGTATEAIKLAIQQKPAHVPAGTELHYGIVASSATAVYVAK